MVYATVDSISKKSGKHYLEEALMRVDAGNSDIFLTEHAAVMMQRREINDRALEDVVYNYEDARESKKEPGVIELTSFEGGRKVEVVCVVEKYKETSKYRIKVITVHLQE
ncbi:MAG: hypothetical protein ACP5NE_00150 [Candidatus Micrarchaeia archaeon]